jgi:hypothetical protein
VFKLSSSANAPEWGHFLRLYQKYPPLSLVEPILATQWQFLTGTQMQDEEIGAMIATLWQKPGCWKYLDNHGMSGIATDMQRRQVLEAGIKAAGSGAARRKVIVDALFSVAIEDSCYGYPGKYDWLGPLGKELREGFNPVRETIIDTPVVNDVFIDPEGLIDEDLIGGVRRENYLAPTGKEIQAEKEKASRLRLEDFLPLRTPLLEAIVSQNPALCSYLLSHGGYCLDGKEGGGREDCLDVLCINPSWYQWKKPRLFSECAEALYAAGARGFLAQARNLDSLVAAGSYDKAAELCAKLPALTLPESYPALSAEIETEKNLGWLLFPPLDAIGRGLGAGVDFYLDSGFPMYYLRYHHQDQGCRYPCLLYAIGHGATAGVLRAVAKDGNHFRKDDSTQILLRNEFFYEETIAKMSLSVAKTVFDGILSPDSVFYDVIEDYGMVPTIEYSYKSALYLAIEAGNADLARYLAGTASKLSGPTIKFSHSDFQRDVELRIWDTPLDLAERMGYGEVADRIRKRGGRSINGVLDNASERASYCESTDLPRYVCSDSDFRSSAPADSGYAESDLVAIKGIKSRSRVDGETLRFLGPSVVVDADNRVWRLPNGQGLYQVMEDYVGAKTE